MRGASEEFAQDLEHHLSFDNEGVVGLSGEPSVRTWFYRRCTLKRY